MAPDQKREIKQRSEAAWDAFDTAEKLFQSGKFQHTLFFCHLAVEQALKSKYISVKNEIPPYTHDLTFLASKIGDAFQPEQLRALSEMNAFNIAGRYEEEKLALHEKATPEYTGKWLKETRVILEAL